MFDLFYMGGPLFMGILTLLFVLIIVMALRSFMKGDSANQTSLKATELIKSLSLLSLVVGMLGFLLGMFSAMVSIEASGDIATGVLAGGLKVALITPIYGLIIYGIGHVIAIFLRR